MNKTLEIRKIIKRLISIITAFGLLYLMYLFIKPINRNIFNAGNFVGITFCAVLSISVLAYSQVATLLKIIWRRKLGRIILVILSVLTTIGIIICITFSVFMVNAMNKTPTSAKPVIVLGCKLHGTVPSEMLLRRLEAAQQYLEQYPDAICVVSGGQGDDEDIPEAWAMRDYLVSHGIDEKRIYTEDKSLNTRENLKFSKNIINKYSPSDEVVIVTDGFHQYRAGFLASQEGLTAYAVNADTNPDYVPTYWVREWIGIMKDYLLSAF